MKKYFKPIAKLAKGVFGLLSSLVMPLLFDRPADAFSYLQAGALAAKTIDQPFYIFGATGILSSITNSAMFLIGALCVFMVILGGFRYATSAGEATKVTNAKNTVLYALIGLVLAILSYAVISFIINVLGSNILSGGGSFFLSGTDL